MVSAVSSVQVLRLDVVDVHAKAIQLHGLLRVTHAFMV